jgi:DNA processing protein
VFDILSIPSDINHTNIKTISPLKHKFLRIIDTIANSPERLYFRGTLPATRCPSVAVVGSRKPTAYGREVTYQLRYDLAQRGIVIISGLAPRVDAIAHRTALDAGGITLAVQANGVDTIYPATNRNIGEDILKKAGERLLVNTSPEYWPEISNFWNVIES